MTRLLACFLLITAVAFGAIDGADDTLYLAGISTGGAVAPNRTMVAGWVYNIAMLASVDTGGLNSTRGRWSGVATSFGGPHVSTTAANNDWAVADFEGDVYWFQDVYDTLLKCCVGTAVLDTQYISAVYLEFSLTTKTAQIDSLRLKLQGPYLIRPRPPGAVSVSGRVFGVKSTGTTADSCPTYRWLRRIGGSPSDTVYWRDTTKAGVGAGTFDSASQGLGDVATDYELTLTSGNNFLTKYELGKYSSGGLTGHATPIFWNPTGVAQGARVSNPGVDITAIFKTGLAACAAGSSTMSSEGFGILGNWVYFNSTTSDKVGKALTDQWARISVHNTTSGTSMGLRIIFKTNLDKFCANKEMDAGTFKYPWFRRAGSVPGQLRGDRDGTKKPGLVRKRPPQ